MLKLKCLTFIQVWAFGLILSGIVTIWSWNGALVLPLIKRKFYKRMLTFMISLAFGCLTSNSLLKYIPLVKLYFNSYLNFESLKHTFEIFLQADGFDIPFLDEANYSYFFKHLVILAVIFFSSCSKDL